MPHTSETDCTNCGENQPSEKDVLRLDCPCRYCHDCLEQMFSAALKNEECYPPSCCNGEVSFKLARRRISPALAREFAAKRLELSTKDKTYCHEVKCSNFIAPYSIHNGNAYCQKCRAVTCAKCKESSHFGPCASEAERVMSKLARENGWKKCHTCERFVEKNGGCNHIEYVRSFYFLELWVS